MVTSNFVAATFRENEDLVVEDLVNLNKAQLRTVAKYLAINMPPAAKKDVLVQAIATCLGLGEEEGLVESTAELEKFKLEMEFKREQLQREEREKALEREEREKQLEREEREGKR